MNAQRLLALFKKNMKVIFREPALMFILILFPVILSVAFGAAFGALGSGNAAQTYNVGIVNLDASRWSTEFTGNLSANGAIIVKPYASNDSAQADLQQGRLAAVILIPAGFGAAIDSYFAHPSTPSLWSNVTMKVSVDQASLVAKDAIPPIVQQVLATTMFGTHATTLVTPVALGSPDLVAASAITQFDVMVPGLFAFAAIFIIMSVSQSFVGEREKGMLRRIGITPTKGSEVIGSQLMSYGVTAALQVSIIFATSALMGFHFVAGGPEIAFAFIMVIVLALLNVGFGLITASVAKSSGSATGISFLIILPEMFLGSFVPAPQAISQLVPSYYVTDALSSLFLRGASMASPVIWMDLGILCVYCAIVIAIGIMLFNKFGRH